MNRQWCLGLCMSVCLSWLAPSYAELVTFGFEATIDDKSGIPFDLPIAFELVGDNSVLMGSGLPVDSAVWNALTVHRVLNVSFDQYMGPGAVGFNATVGDFIVIPEPKASMLMPLALVMLSVLPLPEGKDFSGFTATALSPSPRHGAQHSLCHACTAQGRRGACVFVCGAE
jgi:hypothetical protein